MELLRYLSIVRRRWLLIALTVIAAGLAAYATTDRSDRYTAGSKIYVGQRGLGEVSNDELVALDRVLITYAVMIDSEPMASQALELLGQAGSPAELVGQTVVQPLAPTQLLLISVTDADPGRARDRANALASAFVTAIQRFEPGLVTAGAEGDLPTGLPAYVFETAKLPSAPTPTGIVSRLILAMIFGLLAAVAVALGIEYLDLTLRDANDAERRLELPVLGMIPLGRGDLLASEMRALQARHARDLDRA